MLGFIIWKLWVLHHPGSQCHTNLFNTLVDVILRFQPWSDEVQWKQDWALHFINTTYVLKILQNSLSPRNEMTYYYGKLVT